MSNIAKVDFAVLDISGDNYLPWALDAQIHLTAKGLGEAIIQGNKCSLENKAKAMIFLRHHLHEDLKREYLTITDPHVLWDAIHGRFDHQKLVLLPKSRSEWMHLRLQDFKSVSEYNSALFRITSELKLCGEKISDTDLLEKTYSTFHASNMLLAQQYRERKFTKYSELISCLLVAEQNNKLLLQNHQSRPTGASPLPEANVATFQREHGRGRGRGPSRGRGRGRNNTWRRGTQNYKPYHSESSHRSERQPSRGGGNGGRSDSCYHCGMTNHWSRTCRTPKHLCEAYQRMMKENEKHAETNLIENTPNLDSSAPLAITHLETSDFTDQ